MVFVNNIRCVESWNGIVNDSWKEAEKFKIGDVTDKYWWYSKFKSDSKDTKIQGLEELDCSFY